MHPDFFPAYPAFPWHAGERRTYTALVSLGDLTYDNDFLKSASKIIGIQAVYPVVEIPVTLKIEDYTETTAFYGIDLSALCSKSR